eukprot:1625202-Pleurochrysis_carterae.AAC.3
MSALFELADMVHLSSSQACAFGVVSAQASICSSALAEAANHRSLICCRCEWELRIELASQVLAAASSGVHAQQPDHIPSAHGACNVCAIGHAAEKHLLVARRRPRRVAAAQARVRAVAARTDERSDATATCEREERIGAPAARTRRDQHMASVKDALQVASCASANKLHVQPRLVLEDAVNAFL